MCGLAYVRRSKLPEEDAFEVPFRKIALELKAEVLEKPEPGLDKALTVILVLSILLSVTTLVYVIITPKEGEHFTEFYILGPDGMADNYPTNYTIGEGKEVIIGVGNHEYRTVNYTMDIRLDNKSLSLPENAHRISLAHNETWEKTLTLTPTEEGKDMKLEFLLFNETDKSTPYRDLHLWIDVNSTER
ncbi:hypothetical protein SDC9_84007 [bioreactor metagenome]|uniref:DUF1616 domain-containing protein n=1 Tax=bioreactor metagenome TaxID=1076179 RepID=A0A644ZFB1_9ZZZZ